ncbi:hypothetical protein N0V83_002707 [Neocucurbitaria cava]|uniref:NACHT domain-containing protein n=1 Tax=Neocucurbitaria cava TaxID=798079 RepID=A0A9W9CPS3_9PLEO|nr:hypothetical protein N0V83_002707 [Neocucurbitaria cava]
MRLLQFGDNGELSLAEYVGNDIPPYAILSHTWGQDCDEVTFKDIVDGTGKSKAGYQKLTFCAKRAVNDGLQYFWVDTCSIDKSSSAELSEAINSMFRWYQDAAICYVYLSDVSGTSAVQGEEEFSQTWKPEFKKSRWFTRGWTLQELIAPSSVEFFSKEGQRLGDKKSLEQTLHDITGVAIYALQGSPLPHFSVEERMSWAKQRQTKREEDAAYSLIGIFDVSMSLIYGEGRQKAFTRLRREINESNSINLPIASGASFDSHLEEHSPKCLPDTRTGILHQITQWAGDETGKSIFWLNGMAGTGKSTIARTLAHTFADQGKLGATFFFKKGEGERGNASRFFSTIATDLVAHERGMIPSIRSAINDDASILERALKDQFEKLILRPLRETKQTRQKKLLRIIIVDALDECERDEDIRTLLQLLPRTKDLMPTSLRVLVTSRPELPVRLGFREMTDGTYQDFVLHEIPMSIIKHDIYVFLEHELGVIRIKRLLPSEWPSRDQIQELAELAVPLFIFAATICRYIGAKGSDPEEYLDKVLQYRKSTFSQLERTYLPILDQLLAEQEEEDREAWLCAFCDLVGSIVILEDPLSAVSLAHLLQIPPKRIKNRLDSLHSVLSVPEQEDTPIRLLHLSFRDFLVDPQRHGKSSIWVDEQKNTSEACISLPSSNVWPKRPPPGYVQYLQAWYTTK